MVLNLIKILTLYILLTLLSIYKCMNEYKKYKNLIRRAYPYYDDIENEKLKIKLFS